MKEHGRYMRIALQEAQNGFEEGGIPIGACLVKDGRILGRGRNLRIQEGSQVLHAEIACFEDAGRGNYRGATLYTTLQPCPMCAGAAILFLGEGGTVVVGESRTYDPGTTEWMEMHGIEVIHLDLEEPRIMLETFIETHPNLWNKDISRPET